MNRIPATLSTLLIASVSAAAQDADFATKLEPHWIWSAASSPDGEVVWTCNGRDVEPGWERATLWGSCDNECEAFLNGEKVAEGREWWAPFQVDVTTRLKEGANSLAAWGKNTGGAAGIWLELVVTYPGGREVALVTDETWLFSKEATEGWKRADGSREGWVRATSFGELGVEPWGAPREFTDGQGDRALPAEELELPDGFEAELLYSIPKSEQGSWVSLTFDERGRIITSDQYGALYRVTPPAPGERIEAADVEPLELELGRAHGLLVAFDSLYVVVAEERDMGLYRARDTDGDDQYDEVLLLKKFEGRGEHGPHAVIPGPDGGSLYIVGGNHTRVPEGIGRSRPTPVWEEDQLLERRQDPRGHAAGVMAPGGWVVRTDPDGKEWELFAIGMRNAYDIDFHPSGELFTFDSDMEWDVGLPWYRPTRILHLVSGADFGWRNGSGKWPSHYPDSLPAVCDVGLSSPTGIVFGTRTAFHAPFREALFAADWAYGTIYAVHLEPDGATFSGRSEPFAVGKPFPVTDLAIGPDGALYVTTGGRRAQSGLYRIRSTREPPPAPAAASVSGFRAARRVIERNHGLGTPSAFWNELGSADRFIAHAARTAIEHSEPEHWAERALAEDDARIALQALIALVRTHPDAWGERLLARLEHFPLEDYDPSFALGFLRLYGLVFIRVGPPEGELAERLTARLESLYPSGEHDFDFELCRLLVFLESGAAAEKTLALLESAEDVADQIYYAFTLRTLENGWTLPLRRRYFHWLNEVAPKISGGHSLAPYLDAARADAVENLPEELRAWQDLLVTPAASAGVRAAEAAARFIRSWTMDDLVPHLGDTERGRDFEAGKLAFRRATCTECHRLAGEGASTGPDLTGAGSRFNARDMLESLLDPSRTISDQYQETEVRTKDGVLQVGRVVEEDDEWLVLNTLPPNEERVEIAKEEVEMSRPHPLSRMPSGLLDTLELAEILDLIAYSRAGGNPKDAAFGK